MPKFSFFYFMSFLFIYNTFIEIDAKLHIREHRSLLIYCKIKSNIVLYIKNM